MILTIVDPKEFLEYIRSDRKIIVEYSNSSNEEVHRNISSALDALSNEHPDIDFLTVDLELLPQVSETVGVRTAPSFQAFNKGSKVGQFFGNSRHKLAELISDLNSA
ncbi:hypothetical protein EMPS_06561 [Entomortierella parvispora]|uniref:Thioredoxin domain-containing protein n=1 Tax=Entomortierella parvispora TaxID=205924 RepID=A0A9P3HCY2_9FUNG|nr:hypothetical protein EMPS_06561 [Entomortierella parvispora]